MQNPFTTTFSKIPQYTYIQTEQIKNILDNFSFENPSESVYKITGVRGSGKTVLLAKIEESMATKAKETGKWLVYRLSPSRNMLQQLAAYLSKEPFIKNAGRIKNLSLSAKLPAISANVEFSPEKKTIYNDVGADIEEMLSSASGKGKNIFIGIDEVSRNNYMVDFASEFGKWLRSGYPVYLVCTGLYDNIEQLANVKNLTFFRRATTIKTEMLSFIRMSEMYKAKLNIDLERAKELAKATKGYPYAFQELGILYFNKDRLSTLEEVLYSLRIELYAYSYEKIWEELSLEEKNFLLAIPDDGYFERKDIIPRMEKPANYSVYRDRLLRKGVLSNFNNTLSLALPYFWDFIQEYGKGM